MALGALGYVGYGIETVEGTTVAPTVYLPVTSFNFEDTNDYITPEQIRHNRFRSVGLAAAYSTSGTIEQELTPNGITALLASAFASGSAAPSASAYQTTAFQRTYTPANASPTFTFEASAADILIRRYGGIRVNTFEISAAFNEIVRATWGLEGTTRVLQGSAATPTFATSDPFHFVGASVKRDGTTLATVKSFTFGTNNNIERIGVLQKTRSWKRTSFGMFDISVTANLDFQDTSDYALFLAETDFALNINLEGGYVSGSSGPKNWLDITIPRVRWAGIGLPITTGNYLEQSVTGLVLQPASGSILTAILVNSEA